VGVSAWILLRASFHLAPGQVKQDKEQQVKILLPFTVFAFFFLFSLAGAKVIT
jgi:hypothetical protein